MGAEGHKSRREEMVECLAKFPQGATAHEVAAHFDYARTVDFYRVVLAKMVREGVAMKIEPPAWDGFQGVYAREPRRVRYRLADQKPVQAPPHEGGDAT